MKNRFQFEDLLLPLLALVLFLLLALLPLTAYAQPVKTPERPAGNAVQPWEAAAAAKATRIAASASCAVSPSIR